MKAPSFLLLSIVFLIFGCSPQTVKSMNDGEPAVVTNVRPETVWSAVGQGALLVDARSPAEFQSGHIEGALNVPHDQVEARLAEFGGDTDRAVIFYCKSGRRAGIAAAALVENGYKHVFNAGGYSGLVQSRNQ